MVLGPSEWITMDITFYGLPTYSDSTLKVINLHTKGFNALAEVWWGCR
jgi:hypothetical protein